MSALELLPCPFCGGEAKLIEGDECAYVQCLQVKNHRGPFVDGDNAAADEAISAWNTRAAPSPAYVAGLEAALQAISDLSHKSSPEFELLHPVLNAALDKCPQEHWYDVLSDFAAAALAARPAAPDVRVVTVEQLERWSSEVDAATYWDHMSDDVRQGSDPTAAEIRAIIGENGND